MDREPHYTKDQGKLIMGIYLGFEKGVRCLYL